MAAMLQSHGGAAKFSTIVTSRNGRCSSCNGLGRRPLLANSQRPNRGGVVRQAAVRPASYRDQIDDRQLRYWLTRPVHCQYFAIPQMRCLELALAKRSGPIWKT